MNKMQMAHDCALAYIKYGDGKTHYKDVVEFAWRYADAMQAEAEKRITEVRVDNVSEEHASALRKACEEEWQPDWSVAPENAMYWAIDSSGFADWFSDKPLLDDDSFTGHRICSALQYGYTGNWQDSLRKRPQ